MHALSHKTPTNGLGSVDFDPTVRPRTPHRPKSSEAAGRDETGHRPAGVAGWIGGNRVGRWIRALLAIFLLLSGVMASALPAQAQAPPATAPSAPRNLTAKSGDGEVGLAWQAPGDDGGSAVTGYRYRYAEGASVPQATAWTSVGTDPTVTVGGLTNGIAHAFEVQAVNASGGGAAAEVAAMPAAVSSAPRNLAATPGDRMVMLVWQAPDDHGGISVTGYQYRYAEGASVPAAKAWRSVGTDLTVTVGGLTNGIAHAFEVRAVSHRVGGDAAEVAATPADDGAGTNTDPTVANAIPNQRATTGAWFHYVFPANTFSDADGDTLSYTATRRNGRALPAWLTFAPSTRTFSGTPRGADLGRVRVKVTASDGNGGSVSDAFVIRVQPGTLGRLELSVEMVDDEVVEGEPVRYRIVMSKPTDWITVGMRYRHRGQFMHTVLSSSLADIRSQDGRLYWEVERDTVDDGRVEPDGTFTVELQPGDGYWLGAPSTATVRILDNDVPALTHASVSVDDARVEEGPGAMLEFPVTLDRALGTTVTVDWRTLDGSARAGEDYEAGSGTLTFHPGETAKTVSVAVLDDSHDENREFLLLVLSNPSGADMDGEGTVAMGTIENADPMPQAWLGRFGRTVAEHVLGAVEDRVGTAPRPGVEAAVAGQRIFGGGSPGAEADAQAGLDALARSLRDETDESRAGRAVSGSVAPRDLLSGSSFALAAGGDGSGGGIASLWGRGALSGFEGREGELSLSGEVASAMAGADWTHGSGAGSWTAGLILSHSRGEGEYRGASDSGSVSSTLTGLFPWGRYALNERLSVWGVAGYGEGELTLTPDGQASIRTGLDLAMVSSGLRGVLVQAPETGGLELALKTDGLLVRTNSAAASGLAAATGDATRFRLGVEGSRSFRFEDGGALSPSAELGVRHDGGDAENGFGLDLGAGLAWSHPASGISAELHGRGLLTHESRGFRIRGISGSFAWDPDPASERGPSLALQHTVGGSASGGMDALLGRETLAGLAANDNDAALRNRRLELKLGYGFSALGDRFTSTPEIGIGFGRDHREYTVGWRLGISQGGPAALEFGLEASRREHAGEHADPEHGIGFRVNARW